MMCETGIDTIILCIVCFPDDNADYIPFDLICSGILHRNCKFTPNSVLLAKILFSAANILVFIASFQSLTEHVL